MTKRETANEELLYFLEQAAAGLPRNRTKDVHKVVDKIIDAAKDEIMAEIEHKTSYRKNRVEVTMDEVLFPALADEIMSCGQCPRLRSWRKTVAENIPLRHKDFPYWSKPVPGFGDINGRLLILGLAPGAHGANRTGRPFTGDAAAEWLFESLHEYGYSNLPASLSRDDGLRLSDVYITNICKCVPKADNPNADELSNCRRFLEAELKLLGNVRVVLCLGIKSFNQYIKVFPHLASGAKIRQNDFSHGGVYKYDNGGVPRYMVATYHTSRRNTATDRLTPAMWRGVFHTVNELLESGRGEGR